MKQAPDDLASPALDPTASRLKSFLVDMVREVEQDIADRSVWVIAREHYFMRRYCQAWRNPTTPWEGSSNIVLPLIDKKIDELKPQYVNMIAAARPPVTCSSAIPEYQSKSQNVELLMEWLVHHGSPRFLEEVTLGVDDALEVGRGIYKSYWLYETRTTPTYVASASRLPQPLRGLIVQQGGVREANAAFLAAKAAGMGGGVQILTRQEFDASREIIQKIVCKAFDLDPEEPRDEKAIQQVMAWFRSGAKGPLQFESRDIVRNTPAIAAVNPIDFIASQGATDDIEQHERFAEVLYFTPSQLKSYALDNKVEKGVVDELLQRRKKGGNEESRQVRGKINSQRSLMNQQQANREGVSNATETDTFEIWKVCTRFSPTEGGPEKKIVALIPAEQPDLTLRVKVHSRASGMWGYHTFSFEHNKRRWYAPRGVPEKIDDIDADMTAQQRAKLNRMSIVNSPTLKAKPGRHVNPAAWKWFPGQVMLTPDPVGDILPVIFPSLDVSFDNQIQQFRVWAESYLGGPDYGLTDNSTLSEARTATEINAINNQARQSLSMRGLLFKLCMNEVFREFFNLWHEHGPEEVYVGVTGGDAPIRLTKEMLQGQFTITCTGTIGSSDPVLEAQKAQARLVLLAQFAPLVGPEHVINLGEAILDWLEKDDIRLSKRIVRTRSPEEIAAMQKAAQAQQAAQQNQELALAAATGKPPPAPAAKAQRPYPKMPAMAVPSMGR